MAAVLSSPRATTTPGGTALSSSSNTTKSQRLSAAADLIRNLDAALSGMTTAANSAAEDAARARRNAKAAGEVARRYGGGSTASSVKKKKRGERNGGSGTNSSEGMLERKRERRAAARMAAEARQRREHPMYSPISPRTRSMMSPRSGTRGGTFLFAAEGGDNGVGNEIAQDRTSAYNMSAPSAGQLARAEATEPAVAAVIRNEPVQQWPSETTQQQVEYTSTEPPPESTEPFRGHAPETETTQPQVRQANGSYYEHLKHADTAAAAANVTSSIHGVKLEDSKDMNVSLGEFEDAMEHHHDDHSVEEQIMESDEGMEAPPTSNDYYMQQQSYYQQQSQQHPHYQSEQEEAPDQQGQQQNPDYYNQSHEDQYYNNNHQQQPMQQEHPQLQQTAPSLAIATSTPTFASNNNFVPKPSPKPPRSQPTSTTRIEASHAEDVLSLSLQVERLRSQLSATTSQLSTASSQVSSLQTQNTHLQSELSTLHSELETHNERSSSKLAMVEQQLDTELVKSAAAEEDASLALELAKEAQMQKEECELWLTRSLEEIDLWKGRCGEAERMVKLKEEEEMGRMEVEQDIDAALEGEVGEEEPRKSVSWKDDCPPSPVVSEDGFGHEGETNAGEVASSPMVASTPTPPPGPPPPHQTSELSTPQSSKTNGSPLSSINSGIHCSPPVVTNVAPVVYGVNGTPSKAEAIASGRAFLHRASPSPRKNPVTGAISPHPRMQASELMKKSAETRRLLRERLNPSSGYHHAGIRPPMGSAAVAGGLKHSSSDSNLNDTFASRQGAACKAVGRTIRESGARLQLNGKWWDNNNNALLITNGTSNEEENGTVAQLESMVRDYCGGVEGTIGKQSEKISELLAFCDHLEKDMLVDR